MYRICVDKPLGFVLVLWPLIDRILCRYHHIRPLSEGSGILGVELRRYKKRTITLSDGSEIRAGDTIIDLHFNNSWFKKRRKLHPTTPHLTAESLVAFAHDLSTLAQQIATGMFGEVTALHGCTQLGIAAKRLGFQVKELPDTLWKKWAQFYLAGLVQVYDPRENKSYKLRPKRLELEEVWLSKSELLRRYGPTQHQIGCQPQGSN